MRLEAVPDPEHGVCPDCQGAGEIHFNDSSGREPWNDDSVMCHRCLGDGWLGDVIPVQEFQIGERVRSHTFTGTVVEYVPQVHTDNLYVVDWDADRGDRDMYPAHHLCRAQDAEAA